MVEFWDLYDIDKNKLERLHQRGLPLNSGEYHIVVEIWVINSKHQILLTQRSLDKTWGGYWECTSGAVTAGEDSLVGAKRELLEEIGLEIIDAQMIFLGSLIYRDWFTETYLVKSDVSLSNLTLQDEEVINAKWVDIYEFKDMCSKELIVPHTINRFNFYKHKMDFAKVNDNF
jgi:8-oxo-dGTP diphosphatase